MPLSIKDAETERLVRELSLLTDLSLTRAIRRAVANEIGRIAASRQGAVSGGERRDGERRLARVADRFASLSRSLPPLPGEEP